MGQILKIAIIPAALLWGAFSYNHYKCDIKGFCTTEEEISSLPETAPTDIIKDEEVAENTGKIYDQETNNKEEAWANENIDAFTNKANQ